jgi:hypothetical protein
MWERPAILASRVFKHRGGVPRLLQAQLRPDDRGLPLHRPRSAKVAALDDDMAALGDRFLTNGVMGWEYLLVTARGSGPHRQPSSRSLSNLRETLPSTAFSPPDAAVPKATTASAPRTARSPHRSPCKQGASGTHEPDQWCERLQYRRTSSTPEQRSSEARRRPRSNRAKRSDKAEVI